MSPDLLAPAFEIAIDGRTLRPDIAGAISSVVVTHEPNSLDSFTLSVLNRFPGMLFTHGEHRELFNVGSAITIKLGYVDALEKIFDGEIVGMSVNFGSSGAPPTIAVEGHSRMRKLKEGTHTRTFQHVTDSDIVTRIANEAGLQPKVKATRTKHPYVMQANQSDFDFLMERARRIRWELLVDGRTLIFRKPADGQPKSCTLVWGDAQRASAQRGTVALRQFNGKLDAKAPVSTMTVRGQHPVTRKPISGRAGAGDEDSRGGTSAASMPKAAFGRARQATVVDMPVASQAEADEIAKALFNHEQLKFVTGDCACVGAPAVRAGAVVEIQGLGPRFSGNYFVTRAVHQLDGSGYATSFGVRRGVTGDGAH